MVYDAQLGAIVLFGGQSCTASVCTLSDNSTWFFDPRQSHANKRWQPCTCSGNKPSARISEALGYDFDGTPTPYALMFGGDNGGGSKFQDTWELGGTSVTSAAWTPETPMTMVTGRASATLTFLDTTDPVNHQMVMYGGNTGTGSSATPDAYKWTGTDWSQICSSCPPGARFGHRTVYDSNLTPQALVVFGGQAGGGGLLNDLWFYDGTNWTLCGSTNGCNRTPPQPRFSMGMSFDQSNNTVVVYGGGTSAGSPRA